MNRSLFKHLRICPKCGSKNVKVIMYGLPSPGTSSKNVVSGGCCIDDDSPKWHCGRCRHEWGTLD